MNSSEYLIIINHSVLTTRKSRTGVNQSLSRPLLLYVTNGALSVYKDYLFSMHIFGLMLVTTVIPVLLVPGAPITLAVRAIRRRTDGSRGAREWILRTVHSRCVAALVNPIVASILFAGSLWVFYNSSLFRWTTGEYIGSTLVVVHVLATGSLFAHSLMRVDPDSSRPPVLQRVLLLVGIMAFHAFFGLSLMTGTGLLLSDWYGSMGRSWGPSAIADQQAGGGIAWSIGAVATLALAIAVVIRRARNRAGRPKQTSVAAV